MFKVEVETNIVYDDKAETMNGELLYALPVGTVIKKFKMFNITIYERKFRDNYQVTKQANDKFNKRTKQSKTGF